MTTTKNERKEKISQLPILNFHKKKKRKEKLKSTKRFFSDSY